MRRAALLPFAIAPLVAFGGGLVSPALGQQTPEEDLGGPLLSTTISQRFEVDSNIDLDDPDPGTSTFTETRLNFGFLEESPVRTIEFDIDTGLRAYWPADDDFEFTLSSPSTVSAGYAREWASASIEADARYRQRRVDFTRDLDFSDPVLEVPDDPSREEGEATEHRYDAGIEFALATDRPSSYFFELSANRIDYSDEDEGSDLTPRSTVQGVATWQLQITPVVATALSARAFFYEADDNEDTQIQEREIDLGVIYDMSEALRVNAGIGFFQREEEEFGSTVEDDTGISLLGGLNYAFDDFTLNANLRAVTVPDERVSGNLTLFYPLPNSTITARVFQNFAGGSGGDEIRVTGASIGLERDLSNYSRLSFDLAASRRVNLDDDDEDDVNRYDFTTTFGHDLTEHISADIGYRFRYRDEGDETADSHAVFVEIGRSFVTSF